jgi:hypothetical protein
MAFKKLILLFLLVSVTLLSGGQNNGSDNLLQELIKRYGQAVVTIPYMGVPSMNDLTRNVSITSVRDKKVFITLSVSSVEWFISQKYDYSIVERTISKGLYSALNIAKAMEWQTYPSYTQYDSIMHYFTLTYPAICHLDTIGKSINGRYVLVLKISDNVNSDEDEPEVFYSSTMHGDELAGFVLMLRLADYLTRNYATSGKIKELVDSLEIWINPLANPDGTFTSGNVINNPTRFNSNGEDLNRNFPDPFLPSLVPEKETNDMITFMKKHKFVLSANFHSGSEVVNYPWDRWYSRTHADDTWFNTISRAYADTVHIYSGSAYMNELENGVTRGAAWYVIYGGRQDYMTYERQGREVTIELDNTIETPAPQLELLWQYNYRSLINYLKNSLYGIHGIVRDFHTNANIEAKVFITGHDKDSSQVYSNSSDGRFIRLLSPGIYDLKFSAAGYRDTIVTGISVAEGERISVIIKMKSLANKIDTNISENPEIFPNPTSGTLKVLLPQNISGSVNVRLFDVYGRTVLCYNTFSILNEPLTIDLQNISVGIYFITFTSGNSGNICRGKLIISKR